MGVHRFILINHKERNLSTGLIKYPRDLSDSKKQRHSAIPANLWLLSGTTGPVPAETYTFATGSKTAFIYWLFALPIKLVSFPFTRKYHSAFL